jgi:hypothetical protein
MPSEAIRAANDLRALLRDDVLPHLGLVAVGQGSLLAFELAVRATLNDLARIDARVDSGHRVDAGRRRRLEEDLARLHSMVLAAPSAPTRVGVMLR